MMIKPTSRLGAILVYDDEGQKSEAGEKVDDRRDLTRWTQQAGVVPPARHHLPATALAERPHRNGPR
jgi:hypothetical protein